MARMRPACISETRSQRSASFTKCVERKMVTPSSRDRRMSCSQKLSRAIGSTPDVGSSRISTSGRCSTAVASCRRWRTPRGSESGSGVGDVVEIVAGQHLGDTRLDRLRRQMKKARMQNEVLAHRELGIERERLRHVADARRASRRRRRSSAGRTAVPIPTSPATARSASSWSSSCRSRWSRGSRRSRRARCGARRRRRRRSRRSVMVRCCASMAASAGLVRRGGTTMLVLVARGALLAGGR